MKKRMKNNFLIMIFFLGAATLLAFGFFYYAPVSSVNIAIIYILALILIAMYTTGYRYGIFSALFSVVCINYLFTYPYFQLNFVLAGYPVTFLGLLAITLITTTITSRMKKQSDLILERERAIEEAKREKMRANLLRAVSHDLRTPLTSIIGAASSCLDGDAFLTEEEKKEFITNIKNDSIWLLNMVENLLSVTRIHDDKSTVKKTPEVVEEVVSEATIRLQKRIPKARIQVNVPADFLMVPMDALLIEQVLINLLENAVTHSGSTRPVELNVKDQKDKVIFEVKDYGHGLKEANLDQIFLGAHASSDSSDAHKGMGIGLTICKSIVEAHNGKITAGNHAHGAVFSFWLPKNSDEEN